MVMHEGGRLRSRPIIRNSFELSCIHNRCMSGGGCNLSYLTEGSLAKTARYADYRYFRDRSIRPITI